MLTLSFCASSGRLIINIFFVALYVLAVSLLFARPHERRRVHSWADFRDPRAQLRLKQRNVGPVKTSGELLLDHDPLFEARPRREVWLDDCPRHVKGLLPKPRGVVS